MPYWMLVAAGLSNESVKYYASLVQFYTVYKLQRMAVSASRLYLLCFATHRFRQINDNLAAVPLMPPDLKARHGLEALAWMISQNNLDVKVAVPVLPDGRPTTAIGIYHGEVADVTLSHQPGCLRDGRGGDDGDDRRGHGIPDRRRGMARCSGRMPRDIRSLA